MITNKQRILLTLTALALAGSIAVAAAWQYGGGDDAVPAARSMFPKVLNR